MDRPSQGEPEPGRMPESDPVPASQPEPETVSHTVSNPAPEPPPVFDLTPVSAPPPDSGASPVPAAGPVSESAQVPEPASVVAAGPVSEPAPVSPVETVPAPFSEAAPVAEQGTVSQAFPGTDPTTVSQPAPEPPADRTQPVQVVSQPDSEPVTVARIDPGPVYPPPAPTYQQGYQGYQQSQGYPPPADSGSWQAVQAGAGYQPEAGYPAAPVFQPTTYPSGYQPAPPKKKRERPPRDPLAVALGNASLLSAGYWLLGRRVLAVITTLVTVGLILILALAAKTLWFEFVVAGWWVALIVHGWFLAGGKLGAAPHARRHRLIALGLAVVVLAAFGVMRWDSARVDQQVAAARADGDCARAQEVLDGRWFGHNVANAPLFVEGDVTGRACEILGSAAADFDTALSSDTDALAAAYDDLATVLRDHPGHEEMVAVVLDRFLEKLPVDDNCGTATITDWLDERDDPRSLVGRIDGVVTKVAPTALVGCGDDLMANQSWELARDRYQQLLDDYPDHELVAKATEGVTLATQQIELAKVVALLQTPNAETQPEYCNNPAPYSAAQPYSRPGPNPAMMYGNGFVNRVPAEWKATDAAKAVTVVCAGETGFGTFVEGCPYTPITGPGGTHWVTFHRIAIPVRVFEIRTGKLVNEITVEIGGAACPDILEFSGLLPPSQTHVAASDADVHAGFRGLIFP